MKINQNTKNIIRSFAIGWFLALFACLLAFNYYIVPAKIASDNEYKQTIASLQQVHQPSSSETEEHKQIMIAFGRNFIDLVLQLSKISDTCIKEMSTDYNAWDKNEYCLVFREGMSAVEELMYKFSEKELIDIFTLMLNRDIITSKDVTNFYNKLSHIWSQVERAKVKIDSSSI